VLDRERWTQLWHLFGVAHADAALFDELQGRYAEPWRAYHTAEHVHECLSQFDAVRALCQRPAEVEMAIWFHDAIYEPRRADNETRSAEWALATLAAAGVAMPVRQRVYALILATAHDAAPQTVDEGILVDIDLAILGASPARFDQYEAQIRHEYRWVPELVFRNRRAELLGKFLARARIYTTDYFYTRLESAARENLNRSLATMLM
jgi:predicted metal-dependent HD superfamily phosphohydrolase